MDNQMINVLNKNNLLIQSNYSLNALQNKYYLTILYNMQKENNAEYRCDIHLDTFKSLSSNKTYKSLNGVKDVLHILMEKRIELRRLKGDKKGHVYFTRNIINGFNHDESTNIFTVVLDAEIYDLLIDYYNQGKGYTPLNLAILLGLNNYYAQRIYEILRMESWKGKIININLDTLKESFELSSNYQEYKNFKRRVLLPGIEALNETKKIKIEYKEIKTGRKVSSIDFAVEDLEPREYFNTTSESIVKNETIEFKPTFNTSFMSTNEDNKDIDGILIGDNGLAIPVKQRMFNMQYRNNDTQVDTINLNKIDLNKLESLIDTSMLNNAFSMNFKRKYKHLDFSLDYLQDAYYQVVGMLMEKDGVEILGMKQWAYFKKVFDVVSEKNEQDDIEKFLWECENNYMEKLLINSKKAPNF